MYIKWGILFLIYKTQVEPKARNPNPKGRNPKPKARNPKPKAQTQNPKPGSSTVPKNLDYAGREGGGAKTNKCSFISIIK